MSDAEYRPAFSYESGVVSARLAHGERTLLRDIRFSLPAGAQMALIGETGSGKTMLALSIFGLLPENVRMQVKRPSRRSGALRRESPCASARDEARLHSAERLRSTQPDPDGRPSALRQSAPSRCKGRTAPNACHGKALPCGL